MEESDNDELEEIMSDFQESSSSSNGTENLSNLPLIGFDGDVIKKFLDQPDLKAYKRYSILYQK